MPTEDQLCDEYGVSRSTVRRAMSELLAQRLIFRRRGLGTFVVDRSGSPPIIVGSIHEALHYVRDLKYTQVIRQEVAPPQPVAQQLLLQPGEKVPYFQAVGSVNKGPFVFAHFWFPDEVGRQLRVADFKLGRPIVHVLEMKLGRRVTRTEQTVEPVLADEAVARSLGLKPGTAVLRITRLFFQSDGQPIELAYTYYHPERHQLKMELLETPPR